MAAPMISRRSAVTASLATGAAVAALMMLLMPRGTPCTAERCPVATTAPPVTTELAAADSFVTGGATTTRALGGNVPERRVRPSASGYVRPVADPPKDPPADPADAPAERPVASGSIGPAIPVPARRSPVDTSGRNPLDVSDTRDYAASVSNDQRIALSMAAANELDSAAAELAMVISTNTDVRAFAETMRRDHGAANIVLYEVARRMDATPVPADTRQMRREAGWEMRELSRKSGADFDRAYIAGEVLTHQAALAKLDGDLLPSAQNSELRQLLERLRPVVASHLARAREIQRALGDGDR